MVQNFVPFLSARKFLYHTILYHISEGGGGGGGEKRGVGRQQPGAAKPRFAPEGNAGRMARPSLVSVRWNYNYAYFLNSESGTGIMLMGLQRGVRSYTEMIYGSNNAHNATTKLRHDGEVSTMAG